jgi:predicted transglutaminase-like cysteine proteinase
MLLNFAFSALLTVALTQPALPLLSISSIQRVEYLQNAAPTIAAVVNEARALTTDIPPALPDPTPGKPSKAASSERGVFKSVAISAARLPAAGKWQKARQDDYAALFSEDCAASGLDGCDSRFASRIRLDLERARGMPDVQMLDLVNRSVNAAMAYKADSVIWGKGDYWATPVEMANKAAGDCEDFAIAKYWALRALGMDDEQLQLVLLQDTRRQLFHAVLVVHTDTGAHVLDNVTNRLRRDIAYSQYQPIMSFAGERSYIHGFSGGSTAIAAMPKDLSLVAPGSGL